MRILLVVYDNDSYTSWFPLNMGYLASAILDAGHEVEIYNQDLHHYPDEHLTHYLDNNRFDFVGVGVVAGYWPYKKLMAISKAINACEHRPVYIIGGHGPTPEPEHYLEKTGADIAVLGEGEQTIVEVMDAFVTHRSMGDVLGVTFWDGDGFFQTPRRPVIQDLDSIPFPRWDLFPMDLYRMGRDPGIGRTDFLMSVISGRGCTHKCTFCYRMEKGVRYRSPDNVLDEVEQLQKRYGITYIRFCDELMMGDSTRSMEISERILQRGMKFKWNCNGRLNYAIPEVLKAMKRAGCVFINYGIEALDDNVLRNIKKGLTVEIITRGIEATLAEGIHPGFNILWANPGDNEETLTKAVEFLLKYDDQGQMRTIRPVTPYPGSQLYYDAINQGLLAGPADFYENKHVNSELVSVNFTELSDEEVHRALLDANRILIDHYYRKLQAKTVETAKEVYLNRNASFRGFRQT